ncbi:hypothetical protein GCM10009535_29170 [Streptomyces thermocarboxydovorans]|uniref:Uncharacterized protein n=1 Tax=Streptomyces thermocarboxydovorans TaxID=59298 RepID=A0ABP3SLI3_9ACTN
MNVNGNGAVFGTPGALPRGAGNRARHRNTGHLPTKATATHPRGAGNCATSPHPAAAGHDRPTDDPHQTDRRAEAQTPDSTRFFNPASARSMMTFSAFRLIIPSIGIFTSTVS